jgi:hypothetical protein
MTDVCSPIKKVLFSSTPPDSGADLAFSAFVSGLFLCYTE